MLYVKYQPYCLGPISQKLLGPSPILQFGSLVNFVLVHQFSNIKLNTFAKRRWVPGPQFLNS